MTNMAFTGELHDVTDTAWQARDNFDGRARMALSLDSHMVLTASGIALPLLRRIAEGLGCTPAGPVTATSPAVGRGHLAVVRPQRDLRDGPKRAVLTVGHHPYDTWGSSMRLAMKLRKVRLQIGAVRAPRTGNRTCFRGRQPRPRSAGLDL
jgi:hypothetical protein